MNNLETLIEKHTTHEVVENNQNEKTEQLCLALMKADTEDEVVEILKDAGYWDNRDVWRDLGDKPNNLGLVHALKDRADDAFVEKITNSIDAILVGECRLRGIDPEGKDAPKTMQEAVEKFIKPGNIREWRSDELLKIAKRITVAATGSRNKPSFTISDDGEGQTPGRMPETFLSIAEKNKVCIPFVQGKFNTGGAAVLPFCSEKHSLQFILSRKHPELVSGNNLDDNKWGFSIVRRMPAVGNESNSVYRYLAPLNNTENPTKNHVLRFSADEMLIFPDNDKKFSRSSPWGSLIKLYEYQIPGGRSAIAMPRGLRRRSEIFLPAPVLPARFYECRDFGEEAHGVGNMLGLYNCLSDNENVEDGFPIGGEGERTIRIKGRSIPIKLFALKPYKETAYALESGAEKHKYRVLFMINGQTHHSLSANFFKKMKLDYIYQSLFLFVDCSRLSNRDTEDMFSAARDRARSVSWLYKEIKERISEFVKDSPQIKALNEERRRLLSEKTRHAKDHEDLLLSVFKTAPALKALLSPGSFFTKSMGEPVNGSRYEGKEFPTYFHFKGSKGQSIFDLERRINQSLKIKFETDAENNYFNRDRCPGKFEVFQMEYDEWVLAENFYSNPPPLENGIATVHIGFPKKCIVGDKVHFKFVLTDDRPGMRQPFENECKINVLKEGGSESGGGRGNHLPKGINLPKIEEVKRGGWSNLDFNQESALAVKNGNDGRHVYYVNVDNVHLINGLRKNSNVVAVKAQFVLFNVFLGLALLKANGGLEAGSENIPGKDGEFSKDIQADIERISKDLAPIALHVVRVLSDENIVTKMMTETQGGGEIYDNDDE